MNGDEMKEDDSILAIALFLEEFMLPWDVTFEEIILTLRVVLRG